MTEADLLAAAAATPDDDAPRLVYADWLMEQGNPLGELVSAQCALAQLPPDDPRKQELEASVKSLLEQHGESWTRPLKERFGAWDLRWERGMIVHLALDAEPLLAGGEQLFELAPLLTSLQVREVEHRLAGLLDRPWIERLRALDLSNNYLGDDAAHGIAGAQGLAGLESLELGGNALFDPGVAALAESPHLSRLVYLSLETNRVQDDGAVALAESRTLTSLRRLDLTEVNLGKMWDDNEIGPRGGAALAGLPLTHLLLSGNGVGNETLEALAAAEGPVKPQVLELAKIGAWDPGITALAASPRASELRQLNLAANPFTDAAGWALLESPHLRGDLALNLHQRPHWRRLEPETIEALRARFPALEL